MPGTNDIAERAAPAVTVVVPVRNEAENVAPLADEIAAALTGRWSFEVIFVNDGSTDDTALALGRLMAERGWVRQINHAASCGQSAAVRTGVAAARAPLVATLDGDGQNDPSFIPALVRALETDGAKVGLVAGQRVGRRASGFKRLQSRIANAVRGAILRETSLAFPSFDALHPFLPALVSRDGFEIAYVEVMAGPPPPAARTTDFG